MKKGKRLATPPPDREANVKRACEEAERKRRAERALKALQRDCRNAPLLRIVPVLLSRGGPDVAELAIERIERNQNLTPEDRLFLKEMKKRIKRVREGKECLQ